MSPWCQCARSELRNEWRIIVSAYDGGDSSWYRKRFLDIGIINADHALTEEETQLLRKHPELGADYLKGNYHFSALVYRVSCSIMKITMEPATRWERVESIFRCIKDHPACGTIWQYGITSSRKGKSVTFRCNGIPDGRIRQLIWSEACRIVCRENRSVPGRMWSWIVQWMHGVVAKNFERFFLRPVVKVVETGEMLNLRDDPDTRSIIITKMVIH